MTAHRIGKPNSDNRPLVVKLYDSNDKAVVFKHASNLKEAENNKGGKYYVNNQLPEKLKEQRRQKRLKFKINAKLIDAQKQNIKWKGADMLIEGVPYKPRVAEPSCTDILEMKEQDIKKILTKKLYQGETTHKDHSTFMGFATKVHSIQQVADAYRQLKYRFMDATYIMCAYRIMDPDIAHMSDCVDGGELGAGRRLLEMLFDESFENMAVFVVQHHRGPNLGPIRFNMIVEAAKSAVDKMPLTVAGLLASDATGSAPFSFHTQASHTPNTVKAKPPHYNSMRGDRTCAVHRVHGGSTAAKTLHFYRGNSRVRHPYCILS